MSLPNRMDPFAALANYPEGTMVWFDPSGEQQIACANMRDITNAYMLFRNCKTLPYWDFDMPKVTNLGSCFSACKALKYVSMSLPRCTTFSNVFQGCTALSSVYLRDCDNVTNVNEAFRDCASLQEIHVDFPKATTGSRTFFSNTPLRKFSGNLDSLTRGPEMFAIYGGTSSQTYTLAFESRLPKLSDGSNMFRANKLDGDSVKRVLASIPTWSSGTHAVHLGIFTAWKDDAEIAKMLGTTTPIAEGTYRCYEINEDGSVGNDKGWTVTVNRG